MARDRQEDPNPAGRPLFGIPVVVRRIGLCVATGAVSLVLVTACGSSSGSANSGASAGTTGAGTHSSSAATPAPSGSSDTGSAASSSTDSGSAAMIMIDKFKYTTPITVSPGATVSVMNMDGENHTVTADSGKAFDDMATAGATTTFKAPTAPGSYPYHCTFHSNMHGVLIVK